MSVATRVGTGLLLLYMVTTAQAAFGNHKAQGPWVWSARLKRQSTWVLDSSTARAQVCKKLTAPAGSNGC